MARLDVFRNEQGQGYLLDVQSDLLNGLNTRLVVPLLPESVAPKPAARLNPVLEVDGTRVVMVTQFMAAVHESELRGLVCSIDDAGQKVSAALDLLFIGY